MRSVDLTVAQVCKYYRTVSTRVAEPSIERSEALRVADVFRVLADPSRVIILDALSESELCNGELADLLGLSESAVSHQMRELRLLNLVSAERRGRMVYYRLADMHVKHVLADTLVHIRES